MNINLVRDRRRKKVTKLCQRDLINIHDIAFLIVRFVITRPSHTLILRSSAVLSIPSVMMACSDAANAAVPGA